MQLIISYISKIHPAYLLGHLPLFLQLMKLRLSSLVLFSGGIGYLLNLSGSLAPFHFLAFLGGGLLITGGANAFNQAIEHDADAKMKRTHERPLPRGEVSVFQAIFFALSVSLLGFLVMYYWVGEKAAVVSLVSLLLYAFAYTPVKRVSNLSVFIGAFPGAFPVLSGAFASGPFLGGEAIALFAVQFLWQFPHFWSIAWLVDEDYRAAGMQMSPSPEGNNKRFAGLILCYTAVFPALGPLFYMWDLCSLTAGLLAAGLGLFFLWAALKHYFHQGQRSAKQVMFASITYLPLMQLLILFDNLLR